MFIIVIHIIAENKGKDMRTIPVTIISILIFCAILSGCGNKFVAPNSIGSWLVTRQINGVEKDYNLTADDAQDKLAKAIEKDGGKVRYVTKVGTSRTMYARTKDDETIIADIDPYRNEPNRVEIDINVTLYGDSDKAERIFSLIDATPVGK